MRSDYEQIKELFEGLVYVWASRDTQALDNILPGEIHCNMSIIPDDPQGGLHGINRLKAFFGQRQDTDYFDIQVCNYVGRVAGQEAAQSAAIVATAVRESETFEACRFAGLFSNRLQKKDEQWMFSEIRLDITHVEGDFAELTGDWYMGKPQSGWYEGIHLPVVSGELDNPFRIVPVSESQLTDEEMVLEAFYRYAFGIDTVSLDNAEAVLAEDVVVNMAPFGSMDKRTFLQTLKIQRMPDRHWIHPVQPEEVLIQGERAFVRLNRLMGHEERHPALSPDNYRQKMACARYELKLTKEDGDWRISRMDYLFGGFPVPEEN